MTGAPAGEARGSGWRRAAHAALYLLFLAGVAEGGSRLMVALRDRAAARPAAPAGPGAIDVEAAGAALGLDPYEIADARHPGQWRPRAGFRMTLSDLLDWKRRSGRVVAVRYIEERARLLGLGPDDVVMEINGAGFRGPEIGPAGERYRILAIGDSCTFGGLSEAHTYPRTLERELRRAGLDVEVINAGVEGYGPTNVLLRLDELIALRPDLTTIYIGWNALYGERPFDARGLGHYSETARVLRAAARRATAAFGDRRTRARAALERPKRPDRAAAEVAALETYEPTFLPEIGRLIDGLTAAGGRVVLMTLPGLYVMDGQPGARALAIGHLPEFTDNPFVLARLAERYNEALRRLAAERGLRVVDLDRWSRRAFPARDERFIDSVHLDDAGQERIGRHLAAELLPDLRAQTVTAGKRGSN